MRKGEKFVEIRARGWCTYNYNLSEPTGPTVLLGGVGGGGRGLQSGCVCRCQAAVQTRGNFSLLMLLRYVLVKLKNHNQPAKVHFTTNFGESSKFAATCDVCFCEWEKGLPRIMELPVLIICLQWPWTSKFEGRKVLWISWESLNVGKVSVGFKGELWRIRCLFDVDIEKLNISV